MNEMNHLEEQLRSWIPRQPSSEIKIKILGKPSSGSIFREPVAGWLAPAMACGAIALILLQIAAHPGVFRKSTHNPAPVFAAIGSNTVSDPLWKGDFLLANAGANTQWNLWEKATFHWTNEHLWTSSMGSLQLAQTNHLQ